MGKYKFNRREAGLERVITEGEARQTIISAQNYQKELGVIVAILWLFGCRVNEVLRLRGIDLRLETGKLVVEMPKSKRRSKSENETPHILRVSISAAFVQDYILPYLENKDPSQLLFNCKRAWVGKWIKKANPMISPHWFRKSRLTQLALAEATDSQLTAWAGWSSSQPAKSYIEYGGALAGQLSDRVK